MKFSTKKTILFVIAFILVGAIVIFNNFFTKTIIGMAIFAAALIAYVIVCLIWWRCPHCNSYLHKLSPFADFCPFCGEKLE